MAANICVEFCVVDFSAYVCGARRLCHVAQTQIRPILFDIDIGDGRHITGDKRHREQRGHRICPSSIQFANVAYLRSGMGHRTNGCVRLCRLSPNSSNIVNFAVPHLQNKQTHIVQIIYTQFITFY